MKISLSRKLFFGAAILVGIPLLISVFVAEQKSSAALEQSAVSRLTATAGQLAGQTENLLHEQIVHAEVIARVPDVGQLIEKRNAGDFIPEDRADINRMLMAQIKGMGANYNGLWLADRSGRIFTGVLQSGNTSSYNDLDISSRGYFREASTLGMPAIGDASLSKSTNEAIFVVCVPVKDASGAFSGLVGMRIRLDFLSNLVAQQKIGETGYAFMIDKTGVLIAHPQEDVVFNLNIAETKGLEPLAEGMLSGRSGWRSYVFQGKKCLSGFAPVPLKGWSIAISQDVNEFNRASAHLRNLLVGLLCLMLVLALSLTYWFSRKISNPIMRIVDGLMDTASELHAGSNSIAAAGQMLASTSSEQAASLEETAAALEEINSMTQRNAEHAENADSLVDRSTRGYDVAGQAIHQLSGSIGEIQSASEETRKIIKTIDEIAFQTNILALNAAVEAARAGEAGAGFAVVADEVRSLAHRSAEAAKRTAVIIGETLQKVEHGQSLSDSTLHAFEEVRTDADKLAAIVRDISVASRQQADGLSQINTALAHMDGAVQSSASNAEESASAAQELDAQAASLLGFVQNLNILIEGERLSRTRDLHMDQQNASFGVHVDTPRPKSRTERAAQGGFLPH